MRQLSIELLRALGKLLGFDDASARLSRDEARSGQQGTVEPDQRRHAPDLELLEGAQRSPPSPLPVDVVHDELGDQRVVQIRDLVAGAHPGVHTHTEPAGLPIRLDASGRRQEAARDVLRVDPAFDRMPTEDDVLLRERESVHPRR